MKLFFEILVECISFLALLAVTLFVVSICTEMPLGNDAVWLIAGSIDVVVLLLVSPVLIKKGYITAI